MDNYSVGSRMKDLRKRRNITAQKLADIIGVSRATLFRYEKGGIDKMPMSILVPIARALGTSVSYLMGWDEKSNPEEAPLNDNEAQAMLYFDSLSDARKCEALNYLRFLSKSKDT